jgi:hypothetical protein
MSDPPSPSAPSSGEGEGDDSPLQAAMYMADVIRKQMNQIEPQSASSDSSAPNNASTNSAYLTASLFDPPATTPGLVVGIAAGVVTFGLLTPVRTMLLKAVGPQLRTFADLLVTSSQAVASANAALYTGALTGSQTYLKLLNQVEPTAPSVTADSICNDPKILSYLESPLHSTTGDASPSVPAASYYVDNNDSSWDPRVLLGIELQQALKHCRQRNELQQQRSKQETLSTNADEQQQQQDDDDSATKMSWWKSR